MAYGETVKRGFDKSSYEPDLFKGIWEFDSFADAKRAAEEGLLLQTFPLDYIFVGSKVEVARQIGNAVPVKLAEHIGESIIEALEKW